MPNPVVHVKKRRTFFSSALSFLPKLPSLKPIYTPSEHVLAALHAPGEDGTRVERPKREVKKGAGLRTDRDGESSPSGEAVDASLQDASKEAVKASRGSSFTIGNAIIGPQSLSPAPAQPVAARRGRAIPPPSPVPTRRRASRPTPTDASASNPSTKLPKPSTARPRGKLADSAQSTNEKLSAAMMTAMRASIAGNKKPYERTVIQWTVTPSKTAKTSADHTKRVRVVKVQRANGKPKSKVQPIKAIKVREGLARHAKKPKIVIVEEDEEFEDTDDAESNDHEESRTPPVRKGKGKEKEDKGIVESGGGDQGTSEPTAGPSKKVYLSAGFYCQDANAKSPHKLVSKILQRREIEAHLSKNQAKSTTPFRSKRLSAQASTPNETESFPPLPYDYGHEHFFGQEHDFILPYNITWEAENGVLDGKKKPGSFQKLRSNVFPERDKRTTDIRAVCHCDPESRCGDNCINRMMNYLCGKDCPSGEACDNKSLIKRTPALTKVFYTGSRGFGLMAMEDIAEGRFVIDYRGEVISLDSFFDRILDEYKGQRNFYALDYGGDEVIDAGMRGNEARFINHGCNPNIQVHKLQAMGDGSEEYEVGMWALRDIKKGEELFYDYNFDTFGSSESNLRTKCACGAPNCVGFLGRKSGERSAREIAIEQSAQAAATTQKAEARIKRGKLKARKGKAIKRSLTIKIGSYGTRAQPIATIGKKRKAEEAVLNIRAPAPMIGDDVFPVSVGSEPSGEILPAAASQKVSTRRTTITRERASLDTVQLSSSTLQVTDVSFSEIPAAPSVVPPPPLKVVIKTTKKTKVSKRLATADDGFGSSDIQHDGKPATARSAVDRPSKAKKQKSSAGSTTIRLPARPSIISSSVLPIGPSPPLELVSFDMSSDVPIRRPQDQAPDVHSLVADSTLSQTLVAQITEPDSSRLPRRQSAEQYDLDLSAGLLARTFPSTSQTTVPSIAAIMPSMPDAVQTIPSTVLPLSARSAIATPATTMLRTPSLPSGTPATPGKRSTPLDLIPDTCTFLNSSDISQIDPSLRDLPAPPKVQNPSSVSPITPPAGSRPERPTAEVPGTTDTTPGSTSTGSGADQPKRKSGWASWLKKQAGGGARSLEEWHELRMKRRRGVGWMNMMIQEYGIADSSVTLGAGTYSNGEKPAGSVGSFANTIAALGKGPLAEPAKRLGGPSLKGAHKASDRRAQDLGLPSSTEALDETVQSEFPSKAAHSVSRNVKRSSDECMAEAESFSPERARSSVPAWDPELSTSPAFTGPNGPHSSGPSNFWVYDEPAQDDPTPAYTLPPKIVATPHDLDPFAMDMAGALTLVAIQGAPPASRAQSALAPAIARPACSPPPLRMPTLAPASAALVLAALGDPDQTTLGPYVNPSSTSGEVYPPALTPGTTPFLDAMTLKPEQNTAAPSVPSTTTTPASDARPSIPDGPLVTNDSPASTRTNKRKAIAARNGAPMGWAFVPVPSIGNGTFNPGAQVHEDLPRSARRARVSLARQDIRNAEMGSFEMLR